MGYKTPLWTIIGVVIGFLLSWLYSIIVQKRHYKASIEETIERIKKSIHLTDSKQTIQKIADLLPRFDEREQIEILREIGMESSLNSSADEVTNCVIGELRWICVSYETDLSSICRYNKRSKKDLKKVMSIHDIVWNISMQAVEYAKSKKVLESAFCFLGVLNKYAILQQYERVIYSSIDLYKYTGLSSIGNEYPSGYSIRNFRFGIDNSISQLFAVKDDLKKSSFDESFISSSVSRIDVAIEKIKSEQQKRLNQTKTRKMREG